MRIPLDSFEQYIPELTLRRGLKLMDADKVLNLAHLGQGQYSADVRDGELFQPTLTIAQAHVIKTHCSCAEYDGSWCRHTAALVLAQQAGVLGMADEPKPLKKGRKTKPEAADKNPKTPKAKKLTPKEEPDFVVQQMSEEDLRQFLTTLVHENAMLKGQLLMQFGHLLPNQDLGKLKELAKAAINEITGKRQYIEPAEERKMSKLFEQYASLVEQLLASGAAERAALVAAAIISAGIYRLNSLRSWFIPHGSLLKIYQQGINGVESQGISPSQQMTLQKMLGQDLFFFFREEDLVLASKHLQFFLAVLQPATDAEMLAALVEANEKIDLDARLRVEQLIYEALLKLQPGLAKLYKQTKRANPLVMAAELKEMVAEKRYPEAYVLAKETVRQLPFDAPTEQRQEMTAHFVIASMATGHLSETLDSIRRYFFYHGEALLDFVRMALDLELPLEQTKQLAEFVVGLLSTNHQPNQYICMLNIHVLMRDAAAVRLLCSQQNFIPSLNAYLGDLWADSPDMYRLATQESVLRFFAKRRPDMHGLKVMLLDMLRRDEAVTTSFLENHMADLKKYQQGFQTLHTYVSHYHQM